MSKLFTTRRRIVIVVGASAMVLAGGGAAFAYFTTNGSGTGSATVGTVGNWSVAQTNASGGPIYPGQGTEVLTFTVTNNNGGNQGYTTHGVQVNADGSGNIQTGSGNTSVSGCSAGWFNALIVGDTGINKSIAGNGGTATITVDVTMTDASISQNSCENATPNVTVSIG